MNTRRLLMSAPALLLAVGGVLATTLPAQAAPTAEETFCLLPKAGEAMTCTSSAEAMREIAPAATTRLVTLFEHRNFNQNRSGWRLRIVGDPCSAESNFDPPDYNVPIPDPFKREASSVRKHANGHCNWVLVGPNGGNSTEVEGSQENLNNLGSGWEDRAVRVKLD